MTRKLYYEDCHLRRFSARVTGCTQTEKGFSVTLDATAFYPEGGGQSCDTGTLGSVRVCSVHERSGEVIHLCSGALEPGQQITGEIDYERRFDLMQQHTGEHILSGLINRRFGFHNTGFHIGAELVTVDFDGVLEPEPLRELEAAVNAAIWENLPVRCWVPSPEELPAISYRSKRALPWPVRIVEIPGYDCCACCGVHVAATGEIGLFKIFSAMSFRGGTRLEIAAGGRALAALNAAYEQNRRVSQEFSAPWRETGAAAARMNEALNAEKYRRTALERQHIAALAESCANSGDTLLFEPALEPDRIRELADAVAAHCGGTASVFAGSDADGYAYCLVSRTEDLRPFGKALTAALTGRGGGKPPCQQGRVRASRAEIEAFFAQGKAGAGKAEDG